MIKDMLKIYGGYNLRERANIYAGTLEGFLFVPSLLSGLLAIAYFPKNLTETAILVSASTLSSLPVLIPTTTAGLAVGIFEADRLQKTRSQREFNRQKNINDITKYVGEKPILYK